VRAEYVKEAVKEDRNENYEQAFQLYTTALQYFSTHLKYEKNPQSKIAIEAKARGPCLH
jgi:vacuolar protein-sorting-associated protein 4